MENIFIQDRILKPKRRKRKKRNYFGRQGSCKASCHGLTGTLARADINEQYIIKAIKTNNAEMKDFLFTLGCYEGEAITVISIISNQYIIVIKDARYSIDKNLATTIII